MLEVNIICGTYQTCQKKARGYKNEQICFLQFWFCAISETTKNCLTFKIKPKNTPGPILSFESISVVISQKLSELDRFNIGPFFCPSTVSFYCHEINLGSNKSTKKIHFFQAHNKMIESRFSYNFNSCFQIVKLLMYKVYVFFF